MLIAFIGCSADSLPTESLSEVESESVSADKTKQTLTHRGNIFFYPTSVEATSDPLVMLINYEGEGEASHFGHFTEVGKYLLHSDHTGTPLFISDVVATRTTANGDKVFLANVTGVISLTGESAHPTILEGEFDYAGGTGQFTDVSGGFKWRAVGNPDGSALSRFSGTINTPNANR